MGFSLRQSVIVVQMGVKSINIMASGRRDTIPFVLSIEQNALEAQATSDITRLARPYHHRACTPVNQMSVKFISEHFSLAEPVMKPYNVLKSGMFFHILYNYDGICHQPEAPL